MKNQQQLRVSKTQHQLLRRYPRHPGVWNSLGIRLGGDTRVVVGSRSVRLVRPGSRRRQSG